MVVGLVLFCMCDVAIAYIRYKYKKYKRGAKAEGRPRRKAPCCRRSCKAGLKLLTLPTIAFGALLALSRPAAGDWLGPMIERLGSLLDGSVSFSEELAAWDGYSPHVMVAALALLGLVLVGCFFLSGCLCLRFCTVCQRNKTAVAPAPTPRSEPPGGAAAVAPAGQPQPASDQPSTSARTADEKQQLSAAQIAGFQEVFSKVDLNGDGSITADELSAAMHALGPGPQSGPQSSPAVESHDKAASDGMESAQPRQSQPELPPKGESHNARYVREC